jgi:hypothetical protein
VKGQLAGLQVAADQQAVAGGGGGDPGPGVPPLTLGPLAGGADLPAAVLVLQQRLHRVRAGHPGAGGERDHEGGRDPQDIPLPALLKELAQLGAAAVDLIAADEIERQPVGVRIGQDVDGQLALGAEPQVRRKSRDQGLHRVLDLLFRDPLPGADQRVARLLPDVGQVHRVDAVRDPARAAHVLPLDARRAGSLLLLACLVQCRHGHPLPAAPAGRLVQACRGMLPDLAHRGLLIPRRPVQQPLGTVRRPVPAILSDRPPVPRRQLAGQRVHVLPRLQPCLRPREARPQRPQQGRPLPHGPARAYPGSSSRLVFICPHKQHDRGRLRSRHSNLSHPSHHASSDPNWRLP